MNEYYVLEIYNSKFGVIQNNEHRYENFAIARNSGLGLKKFNKFNESFRVVCIKESFATAPIKIPDLVV